jgi:translocation and assembly module TamA
MPAFLLVSMIAVCAMVAGSACAQDLPKAAMPPAAQKPAFTIAVAAPSGLQEYLFNHLELRHYTALQDLDHDELDRLMKAAQQNARDLLATQGYFDVQVSVSASETPGAPAPWAVQVQVEVGQPVTISAVSIHFTGAILDRPQGSPGGAGAAEEVAVKRAWRLREGQVFTQTAWDEAKTEALRVLTAVRYPTGHIVKSQAVIDPDQHSAQLSLELDSGPAYYFGDLVAKGTENFDSELVRRLAQIPEGTQYTQAKLIEAQQRVADSGYFDSVFMSLDTEGDPQAAKVLVQVREAKLKKVVLGVGASTDSGTRVSAELTNRLLPVLGWRAISKMSLDRETKTLGTELTSQPDEDNWRWVTSGQAQRQVGTTAPVNSLSLKLGRTKTDERFDRNYYLQYDHAITQEIVSQSAATVSGNYAWTRRNFNSIPYPTRGFGLAVEFGAGITMGSQHEPFVRSRARALAILPLGGDDTLSTSRSSRLALRAEGGVAKARNNAELPSTLLFLTGGDTTVRGYAYRDIGVVQADTSLSAGHYLTVGSIEWQKPITTGGRPTDWESTLFIDAGAVADTPAALKAKVGVGTGVRWRSPIGPLQIDLAWGAATRRLRLHLNVGFNF